MALRALRLKSYARRALNVSSSVLRHNPLLQPETPSLKTSPAVWSQFKRPFTSTNILFRKIFDPDTDEIGPDTILFEGCDYNHWLITMDFPKDNPPTREQMIETYVNTAANIFGSVEEAKKKIYSLSTTTYQGFQVECTEETSEKFKDLPGVVFVLPDSYIDPVNKEYGGDKYVNGEIFPRPPPVHYARRTNRRRDQNYGPPPQQNFQYQQPQQQNYDSPQQQHYQNQQPNYRQPQPQPPQQNYGPPQQSNYRQPQPSQQNYRAPPQQNYNPSETSNFGQNYGGQQQQNYAPQQQQQQSYGPPGYVSPQQQQNYAPQPQQSNGSSGYMSPQQQQNYAPQPQQRNSPPSQYGYGNMNSPSYHGSINETQHGNRFGQEPEQGSFQEGGSFKR